MTVDNGRPLFTITNALAALVLFVGIGAGWLTLSNTQTKTETRVNTIELRQLEDRANEKEAREKLEKKVDRIDETSQEILRRVRVIEGDRARDILEGRRFESERKP